MQRAAARARRGGLAYMPTGSYHGMRIGALAAAVTAGTVP